MMFPLQSEDLLRLDELFVRKGWTVSSWAGKSSAGLYRSTCELLEFLSVEERLLVWEFLEKFELLPEYGRRIETLCQFAISILGSNSNCFIVPSAVGKNATKSGEALVYELRNALTSSAIGRKAKYADSVESHLLSAAHIDQVIIVDDFIGTGGQAMKALRRLMRRGFLREQLCVVSIFAMARGAIRLNEFGIRILATSYFPRAISDGYATGTLPKDWALQHYDGLEARVKTQRKYKRGYLNSQSLISLKRTPNNTLPIFWMTSLADGKWPAPFHR